MSQWCIEWSSQWTGQMGKSMNGGLVDGMHALAVAVRVAGYCADRQPCTSKNLDGTALQVTFRRCQLS